MGNCGHVSASPCRSSAKTASARRSARYSGRGCRRSDRLRSPISRPHVADAATHWDAIDAVQTPALANRQRSQHLRRLEAARVRRRFVRSGDQAIVPLTQGAVSRLVSRAVVAGQWQ